MLHPVIVATITEAELNDWLAAVFTLEAYETHSVRATMEEVRQATYDVHTQTKRIEQQYNLEDRPWLLSRTTGNLWYRDE